MVSHGVPWLSSVCALPCPAGTSGGCASLRRGRTATLPCQHEYIMAFHSSITHFTPSTNNIVPIGTYGRLLTAVAVLVWMLSGGDSRVNVEW